MIKFRLILLIIFLFPFHRNPAQSKINFHSLENIRAFADYLFCEKDFLRAYDEFSSYLNQVSNDTVEFKSGLALQRIGSFDKALYQFGNISSNSKLYTDSRREFYRTLFLEKNFKALQNYYLSEDSLNQDYSFLLRLRNISYLLSADQIQSEEDFISFFPLMEKEHIKKLYELKVDPPYKNPLLAGILSAIIPGSGKIYTEDYADGLFAAFLTGLFGYIAFTDFKADHDFRGWIFAGVSAFFYTGSIYGSVASAQIFNAKIKYNFETELYDFLDAFNYLKAEYNFCK